MADNDDADKKDVGSPNSIRSAVENANAADDTDDELDEEDTDTDNDSKPGESDDDSEGDEPDKTKSGDDSDKDDSEDEDGSDDSKPDEAKDKDSPYRFTQFGAKDDKEYISKIEDAYLNTSKEGERLNQELTTATRRMDALKRTLAADPKLAEAFEKAMEGADATDSDAISGGSDAGPSPDDNPFLVNARTEWQEKSEQEAQEFIDANPEVVTDRKINKEVRDEMEAISNRHFKRTGKLMTAGAAMAAAYRVLGYENKLDKPSVADTTKKLAAPARQQKNRPSKKEDKVLSDQAYQFGQLLNVPKDVLEKNAK